MRKSKVQPLVALVGRCGQVVLLFFPAHYAPDLLSALVAVDIPAFGCTEHHHVQRQYREQHPVAFVIERLVVLAINLFMLAA